ncbi:MAG TPA: magnesium-dependent phosphatase-1 [Spirochaetota bacterium]|nr:magnesium-dependent phosphatase-1 [Spirochaetota bacterium]
MPERKKLFVFDLDFTLWDAGGTWCDCTTPPYRRMSGYVADSSDLMIRLYPDVIPVIERLRNEKKILAIASRTEAPSSAKRILDLFGIRTLFDYEEIYPDRKTTHLSRICADSGIEFSDTVFFDDEHRNIVDVRGLGVKSDLVMRGITADMVFRYL